MTVTEPTLRALFAAAETDRQHAETLRPPAGTYPVGSAHTQAEMMADVMYTFAAMVAKGKAVAEAYAAAAKCGEQWAANWNSYREWQVRFSPGTCGPRLLNAVHRLRDAGYDVSGIVFIA